MDFRYNINKTGKENLKKGGDNNQVDSDIDIVGIVRGDRTDLQEQLKKVFDVSADLELEYGTIVSPTAISFREFEKYKNDLPYYRNILKEGVDIVA